VEDLAASTRQNPPASAQLSPLGAAQSESGCPAFPVRKNGRSLGSFGPLKRLFGLRTEPRMEVVLGRIKAYIRPCAKHSTSSRRSPTKITNHRLMIRRVDAVHRGAGERCRLDENPHTLLTWSKEDVINSLINKLGAGLERR
jgi:hypothetical protein